MSHSIEKIIKEAIMNNEELKDDSFDGYDIEYEDIIIAILNILNEELPIEYKPTNNLEKLDYLFEELKSCIIKADDLNKKLIKNKINKLSSKIERIIEERKKYMQDVDYEISKLESFLEKIDQISHNIDNKENIKVELLKMLIDGQQMEHLEFTFKKYPRFVNLKDKNEVSLFRSIVNRYLKSALILDEESILFYSNLITLLKNQQALNVTTKEKKLCLENIQKTLNSLSYNKKQEKKYKKEIYWINNLYTLIEPDLNKDSIIKTRLEKIDAIANKYDIHTDFEEKYINQVESIERPIIPEKYSDRKLIDDYIVTIDGPDAVEIDDGISCVKLENGNYLLGVHIASILGYFNYSSEIVQEAINRVHTIYLSKDVITMFPPLFAADIASLLPGENKLARSYYFEIDKLGNVINKSFEKTIIKSAKKANYHEINKVLENGTINEQLQKTITYLSELVSILEKKYQSTVLYEEIKRNKEDTTELKVNKIGAEKLVYFSMIIVGDEVAKYFAENNYPCLYRTLEIDSSTTNQLETMVNNVTKTYGGRVYDKLYQLISGIYPKAEYSKSGRHSGLDLDHYCHITSELRRAADIVVEHALEVCYDKTPTEEELIELDNEINRVSNIINNKSKKIDWFTNEYKTLVKTRKN